MPLLLDAFNILHVTGVLPPDLAGIDIDGLADLIAESRFAREEVWLVCDGVRPPGLSGRRRHISLSHIALSHIALSWTGAGHTADDWIIGLVQRTSSPRSMTVVTNDRGIERAVRRRGATTIKSDAFLAYLVADHMSVRTRRPTPPKPGSLAPREVKRWLSLFGLDDSILALGPSDAPKADSPQVPAPRLPPSLETATGEQHAGDLDNLTGDLFGDLFDAIDLAKLLGGAPPHRKGPRAPRRSRRDRRE